MSQPFAGGGFRVVHGGGGLQIQDDHRRFTNLMHRQNGRARGVCSRVAEDEIHVAGIEPFACLSGFRGFVHHTEIKNLGIPGQLFFNELSIAHQAIVQTFKLVPIGA